MIKINLTEDDKKAFRDLLEEYLTNASTDSLVLSQNVIQQENVIKPTIKITAEAYYKQTQLVQNCDTEVGFHAIMTKEETGVFLIKDILVYPQQVSGTYIDVDEQAYSEWQDSLTDEQFNNLRAQIHSHVNMATTPSGTDEEHYSKIINLITNENDYYLFLILNKRHEHYARLYDFEQNTIFETKEIKFEIIGNQNENLSQFVTDSLNGLEKLQPQTPLTDYPGSPKKTTYAKSRNYYDEDHYLDDYYTRFFEATPRNKRKGRKKK